MLSCQLPFEENLTHVVEGSPRAMDGYAWEGRSESSKDLVGHMLCKDPEKRISLQNILKHPWLNGKALRTELGESYDTRLQHLVLKQKMKKFFVNNNAANLRRRESLHTAVPSLARLSAGEMSGDGNVALSPRRKLSALDSRRLSGGDVLSFGELECEEELQLDYRSKLRDLKERALTACAPDRNRYVPPAALGAEDSEDSTEQPSLGDIDFELFVSLMKSSGFPELANQAVYRIFDTNGDGAVKLQEFMVRGRLRLLLCCSYHYTVEHSRLCVYDRMGH